MVNPETYTYTCLCGFKWKRGMDGSHSCVPRLLKRIDELEAERDRRDAKWRVVLLDGEDPHAIKNERDRYRDALEQISNMDYRGNRSKESEIAYRALNPSTEAPK